MPTSPGGSVVDPSLLRQAADRGVTICFADLDGADGLWVPEERTVLVNRALPESQVADVIEHELAHVMIDDQHADLDAGREVLVGQPPRSRRPQTVALAALSLFVVVGGVAYGVNATRGDTKLDRVAPNPNGPGLTAEESGHPRLSPSLGPDGRTFYVTVTPVQPAPGATGSPRELPTDLPTPTATGLSPRPTAGRNTVPGPPPQQPTTSPPAAPTPTPTTEPPVTVPSTSEPPTVAPTDTAEASAGAGGATTDQGGTGGTGAAGTQAADATFADASLAVPPGGLVGIGTGP